MSDEFNSERDVIKFHNKRCEIALEVLKSIIPTSNASNTYQDCIIAFKYADAFIEISEDELINLSDKFLGQKIDKTTV